jgi:hypothetical protein
MNADKTNSFSLLIGDVTSVTPYVMTRLPNDGNPMKIDNGCILVQPLSCKQNLL